MNDKQREAYQNITHEIFSLCDVKSKDYSDEVIKEGGVDNITALGLPGIFVRMSDKMGRLYKMMWLNKGNDVKNEGLEDALMDLANYCIIALMLKRKQWR